MEQLFVKKTRREGVADSNVAVEFLETLNTASRISDLPSDVMIDNILCRLPLKAVFSSNCVCKSWQHMLSKLDSLPKPAIKFSKKGLLLYTNEYNSCNGLVCLCDPVNAAPVMVWNARLREIVYDLPEITLKSSSKGASGLGFNRKTNEYKVVWVQSDTWEAEILTLGEDKWRRLGMLPCKLDCHDHLTIATPFKGYLHWIVQQNHESKLICIFDMEIEEFKYLPPPPGFFYPTPRRTRYNWSNIGILDGCLYICAIDKILLVPKTEVWIMKSYGYKESWAKVFSIRNPLIEWWNPYSSFQLVEYDKENKELLLLCSNRTFFSYNSKNDRLEYKCSYSPNLPREDQV